MNNQYSKLPEPFDSFVVGSLPRPKWVMEVVESRKRGDISDKNFQSILDTAVPFAITLQEKAGLNYITDGEWRRESYVKVFSDSVNGFKNDLIGVGTVNQDSHTTNMYPAVVNKIKQIKSIALNEAKFTMRHSFGDSKLLVTLPSAYTIGRRMWDEKFSSKTYPDRAEFIEDCVPIIRKEISDLIKKGFVRFRIDGVLRVMEQFNDFLNKDPLNYNSVVTRIKILSKLDIAERRHPQDGAATFKKGNKGFIIYTK